ncbi:hypothetical protein UFOVP241_63 [uncultured Caudovirales phage]|uniref:Uncharacterized protein n=1 Tax=uncultured Caudovirales phage TaxID=2100421 RepID=A0A6J7WTD9_9CAUD|nr:hypothetical protein UFOVP241_63 [uncultured Caudovirales phage]
MNTALMKMPILTTVKDGQPYVDEPVYLMARKENQVEMTVRTMFERPPPPDILQHYQRVPLRWMKPGPDGKLVPR